MGRHRMQGDGPEPLLPATVEQLAREERVSRRGKGMSKPVIVAVACAVLLGGAGVAWALSRPDGSDETPGTDEVVVVLPSAGYEEGFGQASPTPSPSKARPPVRVSPTAVPSSHPSVPIEVVGDTDTVTATYRISAWDGAYKVDFVLFNKSTAAVNWVVRVELPTGASVHQYWNAEVDAGKIVTFTPPRWDNGNPHPLAPDGRHEFGFIVEQPTGQARLVSCTIGGLPCRAST